MQNIFSDLSIQKKMIYIYVISGMFISKMLYNKIKKIPHYRNSIKIQSKKIVTRGYPNTYIHDSTLSWLDTGTTIKYGVVKLMICGHSSPVSDMMR